MKQTPRLTVLVTDVILVHLVGLVVRLGLQPRHERSDEGVHKAGLA